MYIGKEFSYTRDANRDVYSINSIENKLRLVGKG